ncbi:hypothetical protein AB2M62_02315 [Sphingomonas sp. MMS12-HWE2-04]|uniref:hypothetical protein n=1 Tax=Sphingomonas sp. MMS12-HWE2-04 TaxID=3234199 RepID=UPI003850AE24
MRFMPLFLIAVTTPALANPGTQTLKAIPAKFQGEWARTLADCASRGGENAAGFKVTARTIVYYEDSEEVLQVRLLDANSLAYTSKFISTDGEEPSQGKLRLSPDGKRMLGGDPSEDLLRCAG